MRHITRPHIDRLLDTINDELVGFGGEALDAGGTSASGGSENSDGCTSARASAAQDGAGQFYIGVDTTTPAVQKDLVLPRQLGVVPVWPHQLELQRLLRAGMAEHNADDKDKFLGFDIVDKCFGDVGCDGKVCDGKVCDGMRGVPRAEGSLNFCGEIGSSRGEHREQAVGSLLRHGAVPGSRRRCETFRGDFEDRE